MQFNTSDMRRQVEALLRKEGRTDLLPSLADAVVLPAFADVHVHLREPGFSYKETIASGTRAAARGGYTDVCCMPNLSPVPDTPEHLQILRELIRRDAVIGVHPYASITVGEQGAQLVDMAALANDVIAFSDDGKGVQNDELMESAMRTAKALGKVLVAHCEDNRLLHGGYIHDGAYAKAHGHRGICSESEWGQVQRDLELVRKTGCAYHVCHVSAKETVALLRRAKAEGLDVTCETAPHYLVMNDSMLAEDGRFKMNPPIRGEEDRLALVQGLADGTVDMIATDHAPHSAEEKSKGLAGSSMGVVGLETAFPVLYTQLVRTGVLSMERLLEAMCVAPRRRFGIASENDFCVWDLNCRYSVEPEAFESMGKASPFSGTVVYGACRFTVRNNQVVWAYR